jgi:hypothetical protein
MILTTLVAEDMSSRPTAVPPDLPSSRHPTLRVFIDESGVANQSRFLALGALVFRRDHGLVTNRLALLRDQSNWRREAHFVDVNRTVAYLYREAVNVVASSDARFVGMVMDKDSWDPFRSRREAWKTYAQLTIQLINAVIGNGYPIVSAIVDHLTTPVDVNYEGYIATSVNRTLGYLAVAGIEQDGLQSLLGPSDGRCLNRRCSPSVSSDMRHIGQAGQREGAAGCPRSSGVEPSNVGRRHDVPAQGPRTGAAPSAFHKATHRRSRAFVRFRTNSDHPTTCARCLGWLSSRVSGILPMWV